MKFTTIMNFSLTIQQITLCFHTPHVTLVHSETFSFFFLLFSLLFYFFLRAKRKHTLHVSKAKKTVLV